MTCGGRDARLRRWLTFAVDVVDTRRMSEGCPVIHAMWCSGEHIELRTFGRADVRFQCVIVTPNGPPPDWWQASPEAWQELGYRLG